ncbi:MAG: hypothetical protein ACTS4U_00900 [Candidatus Hodgkinia cicadicola]
MEVGEGLKRFPSVVRSPPRGALPQLRQPKGAVPRLRPAAEAGIHKLCVLGKRTTEG